MSEQRRRNYNFRQTKSERRAENAYSNFRQRLVKSLRIENLKLKILNKYGKS